MGRRLAWSSESGDCATSEGPNVKDNHIAVGLVLENKTKSRETSLGKRIRAATRKKARARKWGCERRRTIELRWIGTVFKLVESKDTSV